ncbi:MAG TPA: hypothetical protein VM287_14000 [Egibacteraceae bacterium]|nr:hypothetical protein [Egibacteraceae bacterium]
MTTATGHRQADNYLRELRQAARVLPRSHRGELVAEIQAHLADGLAQAESQAAVRNLLDDLGNPADIVRAALPPGGAPPTVGTLALVLGLVGAGISLVPFIGVVVAIPLGIAAVVLGINARRQARSWGTPMGIATGGVVAGVIAMVVPLLVVALFLPWGSDAQVIEADEFELAPQAPRGPSSVAGGLLGLEGGPAADQVPLFTPTKPTEPAPAP